MPDSGWGEPLGYDHTFRTGRTARLRQSLPVSKLVSDGEWDDELSAAFDQAVNGELTDSVLAQRLGTAFMFGMFVKPRIIRSVPEGEDVPAGCHLLGDLDESEIEETTVAAFGGPAVLALFREGAADAEVVVDGDDVAGDAVKPARAGGGQRGGARSGRASSKPTA